MQALHSNLPWTLLACLVSPAAISNAAPVSRPLKLLSNREETSETPVYVGFNKDAFSGLRDGDGAAQQLRPLSEVYDEIMQGQDAIVYGIATDTQETSFTPAPTTTASTLVSTLAPSPTNKYHFGPGLVIPSSTSSLAGPEQTAQIHQVIPESNDHHDARNVALAVSIVVFVVFTAILIGVTPSARRQLRRIVPGRKRSSSDDDSSSGAFSVQEKNDPEDQPLPPQQRRSILRTSFCSPSWLKMPSQIVVPGNTVNRTSGSPPAEASPRLVKQVLDIRTDWLRSRFSDSSSELEYEDVTVDGMLSTIQEADSEASLHVPDNSLQSSRHSRQSMSSKPDANAVPLMSPHEFFTLPSDNSLFEKEHKRRSSAPVGGLLECIDADVLSPTQNVAKERRAASMSVMGGF